MSYEALIQQAFGEATGGRAWVAIQMLEDALRAAPADAGLLRAMGKVRWFTGDSAGAAACFERAVASTPADASLLAELARTQWHLGRLPEARESYERLIMASSRDLNSYQEMAELLLVMGDSDAAWAAFERAAAAFPGDPNPHLRLTHTAVRAGEIDTAVRMARRAVELFPHVPEAVLQLCVAMAFADGVDPAEHCALHRRLGELTAARAEKNAAPFMNIPDPDRAIRVAFLSTDFRFHACAFFMAALLARLDPESVGVYCYALNQADPVSETFTRLGLYREMRGLSDAQIVAQAREDRIDVLVDCSGWSRDCRMEALCTRLAPIQVNWLGYCNTTGLPGMDYRIVDGVTDPPGAEAYASETLIRLDRCFVCFAMPEHAPAAALSEGLREFSERGTTNRPVVLSCFNRLEKAQHRAVSAMVRVLEGARDSVLLVKDDGTPGARRSFEKRFLAAGGDLTRVTWAPYERDPARHLAGHHAVDLALDPFPYNGTTTTCEALMMSVPVVTLEGSAHRARVGSSILKSAGLEKLVARSEDEYVAVAVGLANNRGALAEMHGRTRERMLKSEVCNANSFAQAFERALRGTWEAWCARA
ncbi:UDP-glucose:protein N-beta-glucosyltransferase [Phycisphaerales bacterium]|nr:UDP-glucose:protein N-beta-glucosyltransferase [Phycisphaerales bacterium]